MLKNFKTYQLAVELYRKCEGVRAKYYIKDQLCRASLSVVLNIAEGSAKPTEKDRRRFYAISLGSLRETQALLDLLNRTNELKIADQLGGCLYRLSR